MISDNTGAQRCADKDGAHRAGAETTTSGPYANDERHPGCGVLWDGI